MSGHSRRGPRDRTRTPRGPCGPSYAGIVPGTRVVIIGAGGHGRETLTWLMAAPGEVEFLGFLDDGEPDAGVLSRLHVDHIGPVSSLPAVSNSVFYVGIGDPRVRREVADRASALGGTVGPPIVHPHARVGLDVRIGEGCVVAPGATMTTNVRLGRHVHIGSNVVIGHDTTIGDHTSVYPGATVSGNVTIGPKVVIGTNAAVLPGLSVGAGAVLGAAACAVSDIPAGCVAMGVPARAH